MSEFRPKKRKRGYLTASPMSETRNSQITGTERFQSEAQSKCLLCRSQTTQEHAPTVSIVVPSSVIENAQTAELATSLSGQVARTAAIFRIDEIVVFDDSFSG